MSTTNISVAILEKYLEYFIENDEGDETILQMASFKNALFVYCQDVEASLNEEEVLAEFKAMGDGVIVKNYSRARRAYYRYVEACKKENWEEAEKRVKMAYEDAVTKFKELAIEKAVIIRNSELSEFTRFDVFKMQKELQELKVVISNMRARHHSYHESEECWD